jgi:hypothetical protein
MAFPTITEKYGSLSATGLAVEQTFGTPVAANAFLPMASNTLEEEPGWFSPALMQGVRDKQIYNLYGEAHYTGAITGPIFPSNAMQLFVASIGADNTAGNGVTGSTPTDATTLGAGVTQGTNAFTLASATGYAVGDTIQVDVNATGPVTTAEVRKIATLTGTNGTVDIDWSFAHASGAAVTKVAAPFTHTIVEQNTLSSLTIEKNIGGFQSLQFAGCRVNKFDLKAPVGNSPVEMTADVLGRSVVPLDTPTAVSVVDEMPYVFAEANLTIYGTLRAETSNVTVSVENGVKETYTYSGQHGPSFLTPLTLHTSGQIDVVFDSLNDATYGDFQRMQNGTLGALDFQLVHPTDGGTIEISMPQIALSKYSNDLKIDDVVMSTLNYEASRPLSGSNQYTIKAVVTNSVYLPY